MNKVRIKIDIAFIKEGLKIWTSIIPNTGVISAPLMLCALFISLARELMITLIWIFNNAQNGANNNPVSIIEDSVKKRIVPSKYGSIIILMITPKVKKHAKLISIEGTNDAKTFPKINSVLLIGKSKTLSIVFLSFSPANESDDIIMGIIPGMNKKNGSTNIFIIIIAPAKALLY